MKKAFPILLISMLTFTFFISGCAKSENSLEEKTTNADDTNQEVKPEEKSINQEELAKHNKKEDCWTLVDGKVYDITPFIALEKHKPTIVKACGIDATDIFNQKHTEEKGENAKNTISDYYIGVIQ
ncbi:hypothetical protein A2483_00395 [Candidatus Peregrinibacteria bacterium RIFOXYC2_FULL_33_13]|nr:MAG: cytochrome B5-like protein [Candidatus Peregrinibacteria bacterium GW2011_GWC2_33_13]OGJ47166.1 MAG: hypothetical protein A2229_00375 [Candidatus Peregrinibacteria bacterium RIFOXYA2_FULL_33_7]OGJ53238.1 MAG: hypothetical protein A2483_00395 [Candidatus Peregrinibacteria bacterium RIFOXYC2_FULL_33_13]